MSFLVNLVVHSLTNVSDCLFVAQKEEMETWISLEGRQGEKVLTLALRHWEARGMFEVWLCPTEVGVERAISGPKPKLSLLSRKLGNDLRSRTSPFPHNSLKIIYPWHQAIGWWKWKTFEVNPDRAGKNQEPWEADTDLEFNWAHWCMLVVVEAKGIGSQAFRPAWATKWEFVGRSKKDFWGFPYPCDSTFPLLGL